MWNSKVPKTESCGTPEISSTKLLYLFLIWTDCFTKLRYEEYLNETASLSKP